MATPGIVGPFDHTERLAPNESVWVDFGSHRGFGLSAICVTAHAIDGEGGNAHVMKVDNVNITAVVEHHGDLTDISYFAGCNVTNNGETTITHWAVTVGVLSSI